MNETEQQTEQSLCDRCADYVATAVNQITEDPSAYGVNAPFESVEDFIDFEFEGDAFDEARRIAVKFRITRNEACEALTAAYQAYSLEEINAGFDPEESNQEYSYIRPHTALLLDALRFSILPPLKQADGNQKASEDPEA